jgi:RNA polymerase sigma-70 factor (ECF subfamily)
MTRARSEIELRRDFEALTRRYRDDLYRYAFWLGCDRQLADDVVQEALLRAWKSFDKLQDSGAARQWLVAIVRREHARLYERKRPVLVDLADVESQLEATPDDPALDEMRRAILRLDEQYREPLALQVLMGYSTREIADVTGLKSGAVLTRLHRARAQLRAAMGMADETDEG